MKRILIIVLLFCLLPVACKKKENIPDHIIQPIVYTQILKDILLAEANHKLAIRNGNRWDNLLDSSYYHIYTYYNVSPKDVDSSMSYYIQHPAILQEMTEIVLDELHKMEQLQSIEKKEDVPKVD
jgi:hypothetical protein